MEHGMVFFGESRANFFICFERIFGFYESESIEDSMDVGIYSYIGSIKCNSEEDFCCFDSDSWEFGKFFDCFRGDREVFLF
jgi:hypothetical protein